MRVTKRLENMIVLAKNVSHCHSYLIRSLSSVLAEFRSSFFCVISLSLWIMASVRLSNQRNRINLHTCITDCFLRQQSKCIVVYVGYKHLCSSCFIWWCLYPNQTTKSKLNETQTISTHLLIVQGLFSDQVQFVQLSLQPSHLSLTMPVIKYNHAQSLLE